MSDGVLELRVAWEQHVGRGREATEAFATVLSHHREAHRHYHTVAHVRWVVRHVIDLAGPHPLDDVGTVVAAAFYHDVVYDPRSTDNEAVSAHVAQVALAEIGWSSDRGDRVAELVVATAAHDIEVADADTDAAVLFAADLAVLAAPPTKYDDYARNVRREYGHVSDADWIVGRGAVLDGFLRRPTIYASRLGLNGWEQRARANMTAELRRLAS